jgi:F-type H+-transporting ATPase subunit beta
MIVNTDVALSSSGLARTLGRSAFARPQSTRRAFEPLRKHALPAVAARFASSDSAKQGKIHQVIGAVVDGMTIPALLC